MDRPSRNTLYLVAISIGLATVFRLVGLIAHLISVVTHLHQAVGGFLSFWVPTIIVSMPLFLCLYVVHHLWFRDDKNNLPEDLTPAFDDITQAERNPDALKRILDRSESVLEDQLSVLNDTDDKAVRTVRVEVILLAVIASAAQIANGSLSINIWMKVGGVFVIASIVAGVFTYSSSRPDFGPGPRYIHQKVDEAAEEEKIYLVLLSGYEKAINHNRGVVEDSSVYLYMTQVLLVLGIVFGGIGVLTVLNSI